MTREKAYNNVKSWQSPEKIRNVSTEAVATQITALPKNKKIENIVLRFVEYKYNMNLLDECI